MQRLKGITTREANDNVTNLEAAATTIMTTVKDLPITVKITRHFNQ